MNFPSNEINKFCQCKWLVRKMPLKSFANSIPVRYWYQGASVHVRKTRVWLTKCDILQVSSQRCHCLNYPMWYEEMAVFLRLSSNCFKRSSHVPRLVPQCYGFSTTCSKSQGNLGYFLVSSTINI